MRKALITLLVTILTLNIQAQNAELSYNKIIENGKEYYLYEVQESEGFMAIGRKFGVAYQDIIELNKEETKEGLKVGQIIRIPVVKGRNSDKEEVKNNDFIYHKVASGETLFFISRKYGVSINDIVKNNPGSDEVLKLNQELKIPKITEAAYIKLPKTERKSEQLEKKDTFQYHIVQPEETAFGIAGKYQISLTQLAAANPGLETNNLTIGAQIRIPVQTEDKRAEALLSEELTDTRYVYHRIKNGETLESIAALYKIPSDVIVKSNTFGEQLPPVGYMLKIPHSYEYSVEVATEEQEIYTVEKKDDIRHIAEKYQVPIMDIRAANPHVRKWTKLKKGTQLNIPTLRVESVDSLVTRVAQNKEQEDLARYFEQHKKVLGDTINVSFLWPLYLHRNDTINTIKEVDPLTNKVSYKTRNPKTIFPGTPIFREFYFGALIALNDLKEKGIVVRIKNYDTERGVINIMKVLQDSSLLESDLIIGPAFHDHSRPVSEFCMKNHIRMVVPFLSECESIDSNPYLFQVRPTPGIQYAHITHKVAQRYNASNIIVVKSQPGDERQTLFSELLKSELYNPDSILTRQVTYKEIDFIRDQMGGLSALLSKEKHNLIIIPDEKEKLYTRVIPIMENYASRHKEIDIKLLGFSEWQLFELSELESLYNVGCELYSPFYADLFSEEERMTNFRTKYNDYIYTLPSEKYPYYGMLGYDVVCFFINGLAEYGNQFENHLNEIQNNGLCVDFSFERINNWGGFVNKTLYPIEYTQDFELKLIEE